jgi:hypothetical protein
VTEQRSVPTSHRKRDLSKIDAPLPPSITPHVTREIQSLLATLLTKAAEDKKPSSSTKISIKTTPKDKQKTHKVKTKPRKDQKPRIITKTLVAKNASGPPTLKIRVQKQKVQTALKQAVRKKEKSSLSEKKNKQYTRKARMKHKDSKLENKEKESSSPRSPKPINPKRGTTKLPNPRKSSSSRITLKMGGKKKQDLDLIPERWRTGDVIPTIRIDPRPAWLKKQQRIFKAKQEAERQKQVEEERQKEMAENLGRHVFSFCTIHAVDG